MLLHVSLLCVFHDLFVLTFFFLISCRILVSRALVEVGGLTSASSWVVLTGSTMSF